MYGDGGPNEEAVATLASAARPVLTTNRPETTNPSPPSDVAEKGNRAATSDSAATVSARAAALLTAGRQALANEDWVTARRQLNEAYALGVSSSELTQLRADLTRVGRETIFSPISYEGDPLTSRYVVKTGDSLGKIAKQYKVSDDFLARINGIANKNIIREGQNLKVIQGPFHATVNKRAFTLHVCIGDVFLAQYRVGLGAEGSTPRGKWQVKNKLKNPTYNPPRGGRIIAADDPTNPLAERWVGLLGIGGDAIGQKGYGLHGTIEPDSIGANTSMGCIRMYNEDIETVYDLLVVTHSTVTVE